MVYAKWCLPLAVTAISFLGLHSIDVARARESRPRDIMQCQGQTKEKVVACCTRAIIKRKPDWFTQSGASCNQAVSCSSGLRLRNRCRVVVIQPPTNSNSTNPTSPPAGRGNGVTLSDFRLKTNIRRVGTTVLGLPLYDFQYINQPGVFEGVMAQDVLKVKPAAVSVGTDGFYRVNYDVLGIAMKRLQ